MTPFDETLASLEGERCFTAVPDENWSQGRTIFGGLAGALALSAVRRAFPDLPELRAAQFVFIGPAAGKLHFMPQVLRSGKSATFAAVEMLSDVGIAMRATFTFGSPRQSRHHYEGLRMPEVRAAEEGVALFDMPGAPRSTSNFEGRLVGGGMPFSGSERPEMLLWLRHRSEVIPGEPALIALADAAPPAVFPMFAAPAPISTVTWSLEFSGEPFEPRGWHLAKTHGDLVGDGYSLQSTVLWNSSGRTMLAARQLVTLYD